MAMHYDNVIKRLAGVLLVLLGIVALITPFTPGALIALAVGLEFLGVKTFFFRKKKHVMGIQPPQNHSE